MKVNGLTIEIGADVSEDCPPTTWTPVMFQAAAHHLGYDPAKLTFSDDVPDVTMSLSQSELPEDFTVSSKGAGMITNMITGEITIIPKNVPEGYERGVLSHEIFHVAYSFCTKMLVGGDLENPKEIDFPRKYNKLAEALVDVIDGLLDKLRFLKLTVDETMLPSFVESLPHVSNYSDIYLMKALVSDNPADFADCITEVLSEMARVHEMTGELKHNTQWQTLYREIENCAIDLGVLRR